MSATFDKLKLALSWLAWPLTYATMFLFSFIVNINTYYEDVGFLSVQRPLIVISNHRSIFDPWYISFATPFQILFGRIFPLRPYSSVELSEKSTLARILKTMGIMKVVYFIYNTITIPKGATLDEKILPLVGALKRNQSVLMFPEGKLIRDESISDFKKGVVRIHQLTGALILPVAIKYEKRASISRKVNVAIGKPFAIPKEFFDTSTNEFQSARNYIREKVLALYEKI
jgi:1-acyl-sn-glycerol-3-phosphate acyltransferase